MAEGVIETVVPAVDALLLDECSLVANRRLPTEFSLGSIDGGVKLKIARAMHNAKFDGAYGSYLDANGVPLRRYDTLIASLEVGALGLRYSNILPLNGNEADEDLWVAEDWAGTGGTYTLEETIILSGTQAAKMTASTDVHGIHCEFATAKDLTAFANAETSTTDDYVVFGIYIDATSLTNLDAAALRFIAHFDANPTFTKYFYVDIEVADLTADAWTMCKVAKTDFTTVGTTPTWDAITGFSLVINGTPSGAVNARIDDISLVQAQTKALAMPIGGASTFEYTQESGYKRVVGNLEITEDNYYENVAVVGQMWDGNVLEILLSNVINDGNIEKALQEKSEVVDSTTFTGTYSREAMTTVPIRLRKYK